MRDTAARAKSLGEGESACTWRRLRARQADAVVAPIATTGGADSGPSAGAPSSRACRREGAVATITSGLGASAPRRRARAALRLSSPGSTRSAGTMS